MLVQIRSERRTFGLVESSVRISSHSGVLYMSVFSSSGLGLGPGLPAVLFLSAMLDADG